MNCTLRTTTFAEAIDPKTTGLRRQDSDCSPARYFGLTNRNLDLKELLVIPYYKISTN